MRTDSRLDRLRSWLAAQGAATGFVTDPVSIAYLTGFHAQPYERLTALVLRADRAVLVVPGLDEASATAAADGVEVQAWHDGEDPWDVVAAALGRSDRLGVEKAHLSLADWERLRSRTGVTEPLDLGAEVRRLRLRKRPEEVERLQHAAAVTDRVTDRIMGELAVGLSELEIAAAIELHLAAAGVRPSFDTMVQSGPNSAQPHLRAGDRRLQPGDLVLIDFGADYDGYKADTTRMAVVGEPDTRQREAFELVLAAHDAAIGAVRPGATAGQVDEAARSVLRAGGLGERFIHRVGHGLGLEAHEGPSLDPGGQAPLEDGMVITIEPGIYLPGWGGIRIEDDLLVEAGGARMLTQADRGLRNVGLQTLSR